MPNTFCEFKAIIKIISLITLFIIGSVVSASGDEFPDKYHTVEEVNAEIDSFALEYPEIIFVDTLGYGTQYGTPIMYAKISDNPEIDEDEPGILLHAAMHADEILGVEVLMHFIDTLTTRYAANDSSVLRWIQNIELYIVPILNVEGHMVVESGITWWRKTCRDNNLNGVFDTLMDGVDLNRNFSLGWGSAPPDTGDFFYRGPWPFSETEAQSIRRLSYEKKFVIAIDYHSPTYGRAEVVYYPWNRTEMGGPAVDLPILQEVARGMATRILKDDSSGYYEYRNGSAGNGFHRCWQYNRFSTVAFTCEISDTTIQDTSMVDMICDNHVPAIEYLLNRSLGSGLSGIVTDAYTGEPLFAEVRILQAFHPNIAKRYTIPEFGRYRRLLSADIYTIEFEAEGYVTKRYYNLKIHEDSTTFFDVALEPTVTYAGVEEIYLPDIFELSQNYPNPFNSSTTIEYTIGASDYNQPYRGNFDVSLDIFNLRGSMVTSLVNENLSAGKYSVVWNGRDRFGNNLASGVYFYCLRIDNNFEAKKMLLLK